MIWDDEINKVLAREGGWSDRADDRGGPTNRGITLPVYSKWLGRPVSKDELRAMTENEARMVYLQFFVKDPRLDLLGSEALQAVMFDWAVNSGPARPVRALQHILGVPEDGVIGVQTANNAALQQGQRLAMKVLMARLDFIADWMHNDKRDADHDGVPDSLEQAAGIIHRIAGVGRDWA